MQQPLPLFIAWRYIRAKQRNRLFSFISFSSMLGMLLGVAVLILVLSVMNGFARELQVRILGMVPHVVLYGTHPISDWPELLAEMSQRPGVTAVAPLTEFQGMLTHQGAVAGTWVSGVEPELEKTVSILDQFIVAGALDALREAEYGVVIGARLANKLGVWLDDKVTLVMPEASFSMAGVVPRFKRFTVVAVFEVGAELDGLMAYIHWQDAAKLMRTPDQVSGVRVQLEDLFLAPEKTHVWVNDADLQAMQGLYGSNWTRTHGSLFQAIKMEKTLIALLLTLIVAVAAFNIVSSLVMLVQDKKGDIAVLRTMGASPRFIGQIFICQGMIIGGIGTFFGVILGVFLSLTVSAWVNWIEQTFSTQLLGAYFINYLPSELQWADVVVIGTSALLLSFLATLYPARKAALMPPAEALRYD